MTLSDLETIVGIMRNDCPDGRIDLVHQVDTVYRDGKYHRLPTVPRGVMVCVQWHRDGHASKTIARYRTTTGGHSYAVELDEIDGGIVARYERMIRMLTD